ncbi:hypothetical protein [Pontibacillus salipaludis]|uniref:Uncharacterized protein n=1 Tax=Pontibacillus salipaludis TaxID=1697394 RepID=A0ABQ1PWJ4_9BACI|nr:hypothetical protein [Pontibacillus salipaludis]GGD05167.1 hypothetical protein GCM10011389_10820 [Pontibacillus salipaludis]
MQYVQYASGIMKAGEANTMIKLALANKNIVDRADHFIKSLHQTQKKAASKFADHHNV